MTIVVVGDWTLSTFDVSNPQIFRAKAQELRREWSDHGAKIVERQMCCKFWCKFLCWKWFVPIAWKFLLFWFRSLKPPCRSMSQLPIAKFEKKTLGPPWHRPSRGTNTEERVLPWHLMGQNGTARPWHLALHPPSQPNPTNNYSGFAMRQMQARRRRIVKRLEKKSFGQVSVESSLLWLMLVKCQQVWGAWVDVDTVITVVWACFWTCFHYIVACSGVFLSEDAYWPQYCT